MTTMLINHNKQFRYSVMRKDGTEIKKFFTLKVAEAFALGSEADVMSRNIRA